MLRPGSQGAAVQKLNGRLAALSYLTATSASSRYSQATFHGVIAFQKQAGIGRDGIAGPQTLKALARALRPRPTFRAAGARIELSLSRQLAYLIVDDHVLRTIAVSTGSRPGLTPTGSYLITRQYETDWSVEYKVWLPWISYFVGGVGFHSYSSVPVYPASHGCVRVPPQFAWELYRFAQLGMPVRVF